MQVDSKKNFKKKIYQTLCPQKYLLNIQVSPLSPLILIGEVFFKLVPRRGILTLARCPYPYPPFV